MQQNFRLHSIRWEAERMDTKDKAKILIVDEDPGNLDLLSEKLKTLEIYLIKAFSGEEALMKTLDHSFAMAIITIHMQKMDGFDTVKLLHGMDHSRFLPVILLSEAIFDEQSMVEGIESGAIDILYRNIDTRILCGKVKKCIEQHEQKVRLLEEVDQRRKSVQLLLSKEKDFKEALKRAEMADKLKSTFLANISHEIRTPMNSIIGFSNLLKDPDLGYDDRIKFIQYINNSGELLLNLINDVIDLAKIEADQIKISKEEVRVADVLKEMADIYSEELRRKQKKDVSMTLDISENLYNAVVTTDHFRFRQILSNLISNAIKFTPKGYIHLGFSFERDFVNVYVTDTGLGIPKEKINLIFDRFVQLQSNAEINHTGIGLGLAISKRLAELLGGTITVESVETKGSTFCLSLPAKSKVNRQQLIRVPVENTAEAIEWAGKKILVVEDEEINYYFLKEALRKFKVDLIWAHNGQEAVDIFDNDEGIELVLMDIKMPIMDGYQAMSYIKAKSGVPVIAQTAYAMAGEKEQMVKAGFDACVTKPINISLLLSTMGKFLNATASMT